jgi:hypothetical protein
MRELLTLVERDFGRFAPLVRARWDAFEARLAREVTAVEDEARSRSGLSRGTLLTDFMRQAVDGYLDEIDALVREIVAA